MLLSLEARPLHCLTYLTWHFQHLPTSFATCSLEPEVPEMIQLGWSRTRCLHAWSCTILPIRATFINLLEADKMMQSTSSSFVWAWVVLQEVYLAKHHNMSRALWWWTCASKHVWVCIRWLDACDVIRFRMLMPYLGWQEENEDRFTWVTYLQNILSMQRKGQHLLREVYPV